MCCNIWNLVDILVFEVDGEETQGTPLNASLNVTRSFCCMALKMHILSLTVEALRFLGPDSELGQS